MIKKRRGIVGRALLMVLATVPVGCHSAQPAPSPAVASDGMPAEAKQRLQQMSPETRAKFEQQLKTGIAPPDTLSGRIPAEATQRLQQMSPEMRARFQQQMRSTIPQGGTQTPSAATGSGG